MSEFLGTRPEQLQCSCGILIWCNDDLFTEVRLFSPITMGMRNPLHAGYTFTYIEGLVNYWLQDHSIATEKAAGFHTTL